VLWGSVLCTLHLAYLLIFSFDCRYSFGCGTESVRALTVAPQSGCEITNRGCNIMPPQINWHRTVFRYTFSEIITASPSKA